MKKILINCLVATFALVAAASCDRKPSDPSPDSIQGKLSFEEDFLHFRTESDYDSALVNPEIYNAPQKLDR